MGQHPPMNRAKPATPARTPMGPKETVAMLAAMMALNSFAIDAMIPALPEIGQQLHVRNPNDAQLIVVVLDRSRPLNDDDRVLLEASDPSARVVVLSKSDLPAAQEWPA